MGKVWFDEFPGVSKMFKGLNILPEFIYIDVYDNVQTISMTKKSSDFGFGTGVTGNSKNLQGLVNEIGSYEIEMNMSSEGIYSQEVEIISTNTILIFNKIDYDFELRRLDDERNRIVDVGQELLSQTFVTTDQIDIQFFELEGYDMENDGNSCDDIIWEVEGLTDDDGTVNEVDNGEQDIHAFTPNAINRPTAGSRQPNTAISYVVKCTILGLKKEFNLEQDEVDILRQEYIDYGTTWQPERTEVHEEAGRWNTGNYNYIASSGEDRFQEIWDGLQTNYQNLCAQAQITDTALTFNSCYRNPQRNRAVGSTLINSNHTIGHAMDISITGNITSQKWNFLHDGAEAVDNVNAICESGPTQVTCGNANQSHVHLAW